MIASLVEMDLPKGLSQSIRHKTRQQRSGASMAETALKFSEAAKRLSISEATLRRLVKSGDVRAVKVSTRRVVIRESEILRILNPEIGHAAVV